jgi:hypothetical protein
VDPNSVLLTGENSFIRLSADGGTTLTDRLSHWRVLWCPDGAGHALFVHSTLIDGQVRVYSDNPPVARWLQRTIETLLYPMFADEKLPIVPAKFTRVGDARSTAREEIVADSDRITMTWNDFVEPFVLTMPPGFMNRPIGVFSTFFPARAARIEMDGRMAKNQPWAEMRGDRQSSSACLAWSETWVKPK